MVVMTGLFSLALSMGCATTKSAGEGVPIKIYVRDDKGEPIPSAVVRHPQEGDRHRVNAATGHWESSVLYLPDGSELHFKPNTSVSLEISAPGYETALINYDIKKRRNQFPVELKALDLKASDFEEPIIQFGRDKKKSDLGGGAAN